jgi:hypothetical protein
MFIPALPSGAPVISGLQLVYSPGDMISANCTAPRSKPEATLAWHLNGYKVSFLDLSSIDIIMGSLYDF